MSTKQKKGQYFCVSLTEVKSIMHLHLSHTSISAADFATITVYLILCRGAGKFNITAWKANAICKRSNLTMTRTELAISWLIENDFIEKIAIDPSSDIGTDSDISLWFQDKAPCINRGENYVYQIHRHHTGKCIFLPNLLIDGQPGHEYDPALKRLLKDSKPDFRLRTNIDDARLDAILLLLQLYGEHDIDSYGGVNPLVWQGTWSCSERMEEFKKSTFESSIFDDSFDFFSAQEEKEEFNISLINHMFSYIVDAQLRTRRLENALKQLRASRLLYRVIQVWGRPDASNKGYSVMYPLHIIDSAQRNRNEPAIGPKILEFVVRYASEFEDLGLEYNRIICPRAEHINSNAVADLNGVIFLAAKGFSMLTLTSLRLRYRAHDVDTAAGFAEQQGMVENWQQTLESLISYT